MLELSSVLLILYSEYIWNLRCTWVLLTEHERKLTLPLAKERSEHHVGGIK